MEVLLLHLQNGLSQSNLLHYDLFSEAQSSTPCLVQLNEKSRRVLFSACFATDLLTWLSERCLDEQKRSFCLEYSLQSLDIELLFQEHDKMDQKFCAPPLTLG